MEIQQAIRELEALKKPLPLLTELFDMAISALEQQRCLTAERDAAIARAEALERAIKEIFVASDSITIACEHCAVEPMDCSQVGGCRGCEYENWQFDQARFSKPTQPKTEGRTQNGQQL